MTFVADIRRYLGRLGQQSELMPTSKPMEEVSLTMPFCVHLILNCVSGIITVGSTYYWIGEDHTAGSAFQAVNCYSSQVRIFYLGSSNSPANTNPGPDSLDFCK